MYMQNASQTSRLSSHYSSLLAQREAVIEELATHESDLKYALQEKALKENQLKEDKTLLLTANKALQEQLNTTLQSDSGSALSSTAGEGGERSESEETVEPSSLVAGGEEEDSQEIGISVEEEGPISVSLPDTAPRLNVMHEARDEELQNQVKTFSPSR